MAITFIQQRQKQKYLILLTIILVIITLVFIWQNFLAKPKEPIPSEEKVFTPKELKINFETLNSPILKELQPFEEIPPFEGAIGRENPFIPYELPTPSP